LGNGKKIVLVIILILAILIGAMSAYGAMCPAFHPERILILDPGETEISATSQVLYNVITSMQWIFILMNILTWIATAGTLLGIIALFTKQKWFYITTLISASIGVASGLVPTLLVIIPGGSTPSYMRTALWAIVIILLALPGFRKSFNKNTIKETVDSPTSKSNIAAAFFFPGLLVAIQSLIVGPSHMMVAADLYMSYGMIEVLQIGFGLLLMAVGILVLTIAKIRSNRK
jgi:hypothetical protein